MPAAVRYGSIKRFGARYGRRTKHKVGKIEEARKNSKCPYCGKPKVKRKAMGIWHCTKCKSTFAGKAYTVGQKIITVEVPAENPVEVKSEDTVEEKSEEEAA